MDNGLILNFRLTLYQAMRPYRSSFMEGGKSGQHRATYFLTGRTFGQPEGQKVPQKTDYSVPTCREEEKVKR